MSDTPARSSRLSREAEASRTVGVVSLGRGRECRVSRSTFKGREYVDVRLWFDAGEVEPEWRPTKKGCSLPLIELPALLSALRKAEADALAAGLIEAPPAVRK